MKSCQELLHTFLKNSFFLVMIYLFFLTHPIQRTIIYCRQNYGKNKSTEKSWDRKFLLYHLGQKKRPFAGALW
jgi:hypothetical protein